MVNTLAVGDWPLVTYQTKLRGFVVSEGDLNAPSPQHRHLNSNIYVLSTSRRTSEPIERLTPHSGHVVADISGRRPKDLLFLSNRSSGISAKA